MRVRVNLSLSEAEFRQVEALASAGGYKNPCAFVRDLLAQVTRYAAEKARERAKSPTPIEEEINEIFAELTDWDTSEPSQYRAAIFANEKRRETP